MFASLWLRRLAFAALRMPLIETVSKALAFLPYIASTMAMSLPLEVWHDDDTVGVDQVGG